MTREQGGGVGGAHLDNLTVHVEHVHSDLHVPGHTLPAFLELASLQGDVKVIPHLSCRDRKGDGTLIMQAGIINELPATIFIPTLPDSRKAVVAARPHTFIIYFQERWIIRHFLCSVKAADVGGWRRHLPLGKHQEVIFAIVLAA